MAVVVVNFPVTMISLSETALAKSIGVRHRIEKIICASHERAAFSNRDLYLGDAWNIWTLCGKQIDAAVDTGQNWRECSGCAKSKKNAAPLLAIRVIAAGDGTEAPRWNDMYWEEAHGLRHDPHDDLPGVALR